MITFLELPSPLPGGKKFINPQHIIGISEFGGSSRIFLLDELEEDVKLTAEEIFAMIPCEVSRIP